MSQLIALIDGKQVPYNLCRPVATDNGDMNRLKFLGMGIIYSVDGQALGSIGQVLVRSHEPIQYNFYEIVD